MAVGQRARRLDHEGSGSVPRIPGNRFGARAWCRCVVPARPGRAGHRPGRPDTVARARPGRAQMSLDDGRAEPVDGGCHPPRAVRRELDDPVRPLLRPRRELGLLPLRSAYRCPTLYWSNTSSSVLCTSARSIRHSLPAPAGRSRISSGNRNPSRVQPTSAVASRLFDLSNPESAIASPGSTRAQPCVCVPSNRIDRGHHTGRRHVKEEPQRLLPWCRRVSDSSRMRDKSTHGAPAYTS